MFLGASPELFKNAKELRENETGKNIVGISEGQTYGFQIQKATSC